MTEQVAPLVPFDMYRTHAVHIGTNQKSADMNRFLDSDRQDGTGLHLIDIEKTGGRTPRNLNLDPSGKWNIAANQLRSDLQFFSINQETGALDPAGGRLEIPNPVCVVFL